MTAQQSVINRLRVQRASEAPLTTRLRISALLNQAELGTTIIPPAAILMIRALADPLAGRLPLRQRQAQLDPHWRRALNSTLADHYRRAIRPHRGQIALQADAILFQDEAELLACLALDLARGAAASRWWWQVILRQRNGHGRATVAQLCGQNPTQLPAILALLYHWATATRVLARLSPTEATELLSMLLATHQVPDFRVTLPTRDAVEQRPGPLDWAGQSAQPVLKATQGGAALDPVPAPWQPWLAMPVQALAREQLALLGVALTLYQRPAVAQSSTFVQAAARWWVSTAAQPSPETQDASPQPPERAVRGAAMARTGREGEQRAPEGAAVDRVAVQGATRTAGEPQQHHATGRAQIANGAEAAPYTPEQVGAPDEHAPIQTRRTVPSLSGDESTAVTAPVDEGTLPVGWPNATALTTELGGLLYLVNVMERLALPLCFERDWQLASLVGPWGVLEALGRGLLAPTGGRYLADPIWAGLAALAGREPTVPLGAELVAAGPAALPVEWLTLSSFQGSSQPIALTAPLIASLDPHLQRWLALILPWLWAWGRQQFELADGAAETNFWRTLCCVRGRLFITTSHIDLVLRLDQINLAARLHGLDQDPGWLPHWGRVIKFHFEE